jgi:hypothetical protein
MATHPVPVGDPWVLVRDVLAEVAGEDPSRVFDAPALALAKTMRGVRRDWCDRPTITWTMARELLESLRAEAARRRQQIEERLIEADQRFRDALPPGIPAGMLPEGSEGLAMMLADPERQRAEREHVWQHALANRGGTVYTPVGGES